MEAGFGIGRSVLPSCVVCGTPVAWPQPPGSAATVCHQPGCRNVLARQATMSPQGFALHLQQQSRLLSAQRLRLEEHVRLVAAKATAEAAENAAHWAALAGPLRQHAADALPQLVLPSGPRRQVRLAQRRRQRYEAHLRQIMAEALSDTPLPLPAPGAAEAEAAAAALDTAAAAALRGQLCALCAGGCCVNGGHEAYLTAATVRRFMADHPALTPPEVLAAYLARLAPSTQAGSCINHTDGGCSLPREMRSDTCNRYLCAPLGALRAQQAAGTDSPAAVVVIVRRQNQWNKDVPGAPNPIIRSARVTAHGARRLQRAGLRKGAA